MTNARKYQRQSTRLSNFPLHCIEEGSGGFSFFVFSFFFFFFFCRRNAFRSGWRLSRRRACSLLRSRFRNLPVWWMAAIAKPAIPAWLICIENERRYRLTSRIDDFERLDRPSRSKRTGTVPPSNIGLVVFFPDIFRRISNVPTRSVRENGNESPLKYLVLSAFFL